ncbi:MAG: DUF72 domain-containing protein [Nitrososphaerales archaeon]
MPDLNLGTSGWSYKDWEGIFYPDSKTSKLKYYASVFSTVEIDSTFYANPSRGMVFGWARNTPPNFEFSLKLPKTITHEKMLKLSEGTEVDLYNFLDLLSPLKESSKLGPLLIQLPPSFSLDCKEDLEGFLGALPKENRFAIEFRNKSWLKDPDVNSLLSRFKVANTIVDEPLMPIDLTTPAEFAFIRWHGRGRRPWYNYLYNDKELDPWVERVNDLSSKVKKIYGYFNNHFHGNAVENSLEFMEKIGSATRTQQKTLKKVKEKRAQKQTTL